MNFPAQPTFDGLAIAPKMLEVLDRLKFKTPTPIQQKAILPAIEGKDVMGTGPLRFRESGLVL